MEKMIKMFIETPDGKKLEQDVPQGLVEIYLEKGWKKVEKVIEEPLRFEKTEKTYFNTRKKNK